MHIVVLGCNGMLGSMLVFTAQKRGIPVQGLQRPVIDANMTLSQLRDVIMSFDADSVVINCIGAIPQKSYTSEEFKQINQGFPHLLATCCKERNLPFFHMSTNCVFAGDQPLCSESDVPNAEDIYGRTKYLGEPDYGVIVRSSILGPERTGAYGLLEWFLHQASDVQGYTDHMWNGVTTWELSNVLCDFVEAGDASSRLLHICSVDVVSKYDILDYVKKLFAKDIGILPVQKGEKHYTLTSNCTDPRPSIFKQLEDLVGIWEEYKAI
jgi:dTDP-4-dehydrorhamnose reductase